MFIVKMGMYSYFEYEDIEVKDWNGLNSFFEEWDKYQNKCKIENKLDYTRRKEMIEKDDKGKEYLTFESWNELKLISYWYDEQLIFLTLIAKYIEGSVDWEFENKDETGSIEFENGECKITSGEMVYSYWNANEKVSLDKLPTKLKKIAILGNLK